jgi:hypothetical protein
VIRDIEKIIECFNKDKKYLMDESNRQRVKALKERIVSNKEIVEWVRRSKVLQDLLSQFERVVKVSLTYNSQGREEPSCYVFEGPPGCRKSVIVNKVIELLNEPCYCHLVKSVSDGKDWYDNYNNEEIFYMDDVGQQGISQWRTIINMVSSVKMPLECADASLKDTKFFNSNKIIVTTNMFSNLAGICRNDCISDVKALWRRGFVFDFARVSTRGDAMLGEVNFKYFNIETQRWEVGFPAYIREKCPSLNRLEPRCSVVDVNVFLLWIHRIMKSIEYVKKLIFKTSHVDENLRDRAKEAESFYLPQEENNLQVAVYEGAHHFQPLERQQAHMMDREGFLYDENHGFIGINRRVFDWRINEQVREMWLGQGLSNLFSTSNINVIDWYDNIKGFSISCVESFNSIFTSGWFKDVVLGTCKDMFNDLINSIGTTLKDNWFYFVPLFLLGAGLTYFLFNKFTKREENDWRIQMSEVQVADVHTSVKSVSSQVFSLDLICENFKVECECLVSGRHIIIPAHVLSQFSQGSKFFVVLYVNKKENKRIVEYESVEVVYRNDIDDIALLALPKSFPSPFKSMSKWFKNDVEGRKSLLSVGQLICSGGIIVPLSNIRASWFSRNVKYFYNKWSGELRNEDLSYEIHGPGMCGSIIFSPEGGFMGFHIAGNATIKQGVARIFSEKVKMEVKNLLDQSYFSLPYSVKEQKDGDTSVMKLDFKSNATVPSKTNFGPTPLFNHFEGSREPANLRLTGKHTLKDVAKKSFSTTGYITAEEVEFGKSMLEAIIDDYTDLDVETVVGGDDLLAPLNKDSSNGYGQLKLKEDYIDFENKKYTPLLEAELREIRDKIDKNDYPYDKLAWHETLKDELRGVEKKGEPRSFRVATIHNQVLCKEKFGNMVKHILKHRNFNKIMVGVNPFKDWDEIYHELASCKLVMAADIKKYDGKMLPQVQRLVSDVLLNKYKGNEPELCASLLETLVHTFLFVLDDTYLTTHSFPSGHFLTAIVNSFVNRVYTAIWYRRMMIRKNLPYSVSSFFQHVKDYVYGDDKLNGITDHEDVLNALTLREFFQSIGLELTTSTKQEITRAGEEMHELEFLKRKFVFHPVIGRVMCPLDMRTLNSGLRYSDMTKDMDQVLQDKLHNYQREIYLHSNYKQLLQEFIIRMNESGVHYSLLPESYLKFLYTTDKELDALKQHYM